MEKCPIWVRRAQVLWYGLQSCFAGWFSRFLDGTFSPYPPSCNRLTHAKTGLLKRSGAEHDPLGELVFLCFPAYSTVNAGIVDGFAQERGFECED